MKAPLLKAFAPYMQAQSNLASQAIRPQLPAVTISRETAAGAVTIAKMVAERLDHREKSEDRCPWAVFDRNLAEKVLEEHNLPTKLKEFMPEDAISPVDDVLEELLGLHPSQWTLVQHTIETVLRLAALGNVVLVGMGANLITAKLKHVLHVRLVAPLDQRLRHAEQYYHLSPKDAVEFVRKQDLARRRFVRRYFNADIEDPLGYDLTINTGQLGFAETTRIIAEGVAGLKSHLEHKAA
jgi:cytidylate kinase